VCLNNKTQISENGVIFGIVIDAPNSFKEALNCIGNGPHSVSLRPVVDVIKKTEIIK
jgi:hypothetical protein